MSVIKKVLNSSVVLVDDKGKEMIALGKGIGYGKKPGEVLEKNQISQLFFPVETPQARQLFYLIENIPSQYFDMTNDILSFSEQLLDETVSPLLYLSLTDHIHFAIERHQQGIVLSNKVFWEVKLYYPQEFKIGQYAIGLIENVFQETLPEEEAANIAFHFINARQAGDEKNAQKSVKMIGNIVNLVKYTLGKSLKEDSIHYKRFIVHIRFFVERFLSHEMINDDNMLLFQQVSENYPKAMEDAKKIQQFIYQHYGSKISVDEVTYLAIHINRLLKDAE
ncbi:PRD domain-containing protein [Granulicatella sp. zg-ZJ]|uniref:PRD domain-containing protein n=1 Tax=Granulicatella sp. zg-ZJ TaxID=2678504 RepID=UPI0013D45644|nr:PRD domain-containing protein [Granulicatella sp. zg-ZJ]NEW62162.1 PRD domain-containing protein [Granulicatella sp. zg-ZJ]